jgi:hypothetical protein
LLGFVATCMLVLSPSAFAAHPEVNHFADSGTTVFSNPDNGRAVITHAAGPASVTLISGDPDGLHVEEFTYRGLVEQVRMKQGALLLRDAGYIVFHNTFDGDEFISSEIVIDRGPHPDAESDFELFCEVTTAALGID